ncbi:2-oxo-4-hydroxy-4-carboxy-5-ureidoimidazoline decarboxylase [Priestia aryabhattai]|uniref:2-oxo-4-hydroxy-4-carboxy-5-ureidoimidazoline decarboxylase n=1 Tax=Priestia aryabhattai TaxID=412384 RepID=UPI003D2AAE07
MNNVSVQYVNQLSKQHFVSLVGDIFEHSPWVAEEAYSKRPFSSIEQLHGKMKEIVAQASVEKQLKLLQAHPNLGENIAMTSASTEEQTKAGLQNLTQDDYEQFSSLNRTYMEKFPFPFILAVRGKQKEDIYEAMQSRLQNTKQMEFDTALEEVYKIAFFRLTDKITEDKETKKRA